MTDITNPIFHDEIKARLHLESLRWPNGPRCPHCGGKDVTRLEGKAKDMGQLICNPCRKKFTVTVGTLFERSHIKLHKWILAFHLMAASKKGISAHQLHRMLNVTYKTAWFMAHRIREAMRDDSGVPMGGDGKDIEADETYLGRKPRAKDYVFVSGKGWVLTSYYDRKQKILSLVERGGRAKSFHIATMTVNTIRPLITTTVDRSSNLMTDESSLYRWAKKEFKTHGRVVHKKKEYARGRVSTNSVEGFFSIFKRGMKGIYQHCSEKHLHRYLCEFDFRYSLRKITDWERANIALKMTEGKRLTYRRGA